jgi:hypothetical protein
MKLEGQAAIDFYEWTKHKGLDNWKAKDYSLDAARAMAYSIIEIWFDSINQSIGKIGRGYNCYYHEYTGIMTQHKTRHEAQEKAVSTGCKFYNKSHARKNSSNT